MDEKKTSKSAETTAEAPVRKTVFSLERLRRDCLELLGVTTSTFDGAVFGLEGDFTVDEIREIIRKWQNKPVLLKTKKEGK